MKWMFAILLILATRLSAIGQMESDGSIALAEWSQDEIVIAADSREVRGGNSYVDTGCKVAAFDNELIFAATGRTQIAGDPGWDSYALAPKLFKRMTGKGATDRLAARMAEAWGLAVKAEFQKHSAAALAGLRPDYVTTAFFADFERDGTLLLSVSKITFRRIGGKVTVIASPELIPVGGGNYLLGHNEIRDKMIAQSTAQGVAWHEALSRRINASSDQVAEEAMGIVELTIANLPKLKTDANGVQFSEVGPPAATVRLRRGKGTDWIQKGRCGEE